MFRSHSWIAWSWDCKSDPQNLVPAPSSIRINWEQDSHANLMPHQRPTESETLAWSPAICVVTNPPDDSDTCCSLRTTDMPGHTEKPELRLDFSSCGHDVLNEIWCYILTLKANCSVTSNPIFLAPTEQFILASEKKEKSPSLITMPGFILRTRPALNYKICFVV